MAPDARIQVDGFGFLPGDKLGKPRKIVRRYTLTNENKASVQLISWGAGIQSIRIPNNKNILGDVVLGYDSIDGYLKNRYTGRLIGRVVNRIADGIMFINNKKYQLSKNENEINHINGGFFGFDNVNWESYVLGNQVVMSHLSRSDNEGYPGHMLIQVKYSWTNENELHINIRATTTKPTPANITNYCLFNLAGHATGAKELKNHVVTINADKWTFMDIEDNLPSGAIRPVDCTVYDLRHPTQLNKKRLYSVPGGGYNHNLCISSPSSWCYRFHARILHPSSGRFLEVYSNQPGLQFYTGNDLPDPERIYPPDLEDYVWGGCGDTSENNKTKQEPKFCEKIENEIRCKEGALYRRHGGFALSPQNYPDAVNLKKFPCCILCPGKVYNHDMTYKFGLLQKTNFHHNIGC